MRYIGEYVIPVAALILLVVVWSWEEVLIVVGLVKWFIKEDDRATR